MNISYCDGCKKELGPKEIDRASGFSRITREKKFGPYSSVKIEIHTCVDGTWNGGNLCEACVIDVAINGSNCRAGK